MCTFYFFCFRHLYTHTRTHVFQSFSFTLSYLTTKTTTRKTERNLGQQRTKTRLINLFLICFTAFHYSVVSCQYKNLFRSMKKSFKVYGEKVIYLKVAHLRYFAVVETDKNHKILCSNFIFDKKNAQNKRKV